MRNIRLLTLCAVLSAAASASALDTSAFTYSYRASVMTILENNGMYGDPAPIMPVPGFAVSMPLAPFVYFEPSVDMYATYYGYSSELGRAVPYAIENRSATVVGAVVGAPVEVDFRIKGIAGFHALFGPAFDLRLCLTADGLEGSDAKEAAAETSRVAGYFWGGGRWIFAETGFGFDFPFTEKTNLGLDLRAWYPVYRFWTGEKLPAVENIRLALGLSLSFR